MATIRNSYNGERVALKTNHLFGRSGPRVNTRIDDASVSSVHAAIRWNGLHWTLFDLSRNGTLVNSTHIHNDSIALSKVKTQIQFGIQCNSKWTIETLEPPATMLWNPETGASITLTDAGIPIRTADFPGRCISHIDGRGWYQRVNNTEIRLNDGDDVSWNGQCWKFFVDFECDRTSSLVSDDPISAGGFKFIFHSSLDEEHISLSIDMNGTRINLGERVHHYCLMLLAKKRNEDCENGLDADNQGWISLEYLSRMTGQSVAHLNIHIFRARNQIAGALNNSALINDFIERRRNQIRFGAFDFDVEKGSAIQTRYTVNRNYILTL